MFFGNASNERVVINLGFYKAIFLEMPVMERFVEN